MRPRLARVVGKVVRVVLNYALWRIGLEHPIGEPVLLAKNDGFFLGVKVQPHLLSRVGRTLSNPSAARSLCATVRSRAPMIGFWGGFAWRSWRERRCVREVSRALTLLLRRWQLSSSACPGNAKGPPPVQRCDPSDGRSWIKAQRGPRTPCRLGLRS